MIKQLLLRLGYPNLEFESEIWKKDKKCRGCFIKKILKKQVGIGINKKDLEQKFGTVWRVYSSGAWSYEVPHFWRRKKKRVLNFYFDENDLVKDIKVKHRIRR